MALSSTSAAPTVAWGTLPQSRPNGRLSLRAFLWRSKTGLPARSAFTAATFAKKPRPPKTIQRRAAIILRATPPSPWWYLGV
jgi:hypothetical protein